VTADVISAFSSDGRIAADTLVVLSDPRGAIPPYDAVILISPKRADDRRLIAALQPLIGAIPVDGHARGQLQRRPRTPARQPGAGGGRLLRRTS
jgi:osmoprotectant transport system permease protein